jgi:hypothetical protein
LRMLRGIHLVDDKGSDRGTTNVANGALRRVALLLLSGTNKTTKVFALDVVEIGSLTLVALRLILATVECLVESARGFTLLVPSLLAFR